MSCHVMSCDVMSFDVMWFLALCYVTWCNVMSCDVFSCDEHHLLWSDAAQWYAISWVCDEMWLVAMSRCVVRSGCVMHVVNWKMSWWSVLQSTASTTRYYKVLQSTTPCSKILPSTTPYYTVRCYKVPLRTTISTTTYYSVLQSITPFDSPTHETPSATHEATGVTLELHQIWRLPRKMILMIDPCLAHQTSNTMRRATGVTLQPHQILRLTIVQHMKRPVLCAKQQESPSNFTKYGACHEKWFWWLILVSHQTSNTMRGATGVTLQPHQVLRLPRNYVEWLSWLMPVTYETSFTMRGAMGLTLQRHQILRLPRKMTLMIAARHIWNVIYNARSNRTHPPTSPNIAPATNNCIPKSKRNWPKTVEKSFTMIRPWSEHVRHEIAKLTPSARRAPFFRLRTHFVLKNRTCRAPAIYPGFTKYCACHEKWHSKITKCCACHKSHSTMCDTNDMKRHLHCAEQQASPSNLTKYCARRCTK